MNEQDAKNQNFWLATCWIAGMLLAVVITVVFSISNNGLEHVSNDVLKWLAQVLAPICLLVLSRVFGQKIVQQFGALVDRSKVYWLAMAMSLVFIAFVIGTIFATAYACPRATKEPSCQLQQLQTLANSGTTILIVLIWPILSMILDYLFPKAEPAPNPPGSVFAAQP